MNFLPEDAWKQRQVDVARRRLARPKPTRRELREHALRLSSQGKDLPVREADLDAARLRRGAMT